MFRDRIVDKHLKFDVRPPKEGRITAMVHNAKPDDPAEDMHLTFIVRNYGTAEEPRLWTPGPAFLNMPNKVFEKVSAVGIELDKAIQAGEHTETVMGGTIAKITRTEGGIRYNALQSRNNLDNTVVYWTVTDVASPFAGLTSQFTLVPSRNQEGARHIVASGYVPGTKSFNRVDFCRSEKMTPVNGGSPRWVNIVNDEWDAIGYLTLVSIREALVLLIVDSNVTIVNTA